jgi:hypothetical protein
MIFVESALLRIFEPGNNIASYYLGTMLSNAGIANTTTKLEIVSQILLVYISSS